MAATVQETPLGRVTPPANVVGLAFVNQYYLILHQSPELVHRFYQDNSKLGRVEENGEMGTTTTMQAINEKMLSLDYGGLTAEIVSVDSQESYNGGVIVLVTGYLTRKDHNRQKFAQSFFLAPQDKGYYVLNDVFRDIEDDNKYYPQDSVTDAEAPLIPNQDPSPVQENHVPEQTHETQEEANDEEVYNPSENGPGSIVEEEAPVPEVIDEIPHVNHVVSENSKTEEVPKKSYASIVMKESPALLSTPPPALPRSVAKSQENQVTTVVDPAPVSETKGSNSNGVENGHNQDGENNGYSIYIKGLPMNATPAVLESEFKRFGPIKSGGIQVRSQKGFSFGFVEFEVESAVQSAIEASPVMINGCQAVVEEKRSTNRGNFRGRFFPARGTGFRNEGARGRSNYNSGGGGGGGGGRGGYNTRGDFNNRTDFGNRSNNRGGFSNRGGDGYQRSDSMGSNNGGRMNRPGGVNGNATRRVLVE